MVVLAPISAQHHTIETREGRKDKLVLRRGVVEVLLASGLEVNVRTCSGTALHEAALCGKTEVVKTLLDNGADLSIKDSHNNTVSDLLQQFPSHVVHDITSLIKSE